MAYSKESLDLIDEIHKVAHSENTVVDEDVLAPVIDNLRNLLNAKTTVKDFAKANDIPEYKVRNAIACKAIKKPQSRAMWDWNYLKSLVTKKPSI